MIILNKNRQQIQLTQGLPIYFRLELWLLLEERSNMSKRDRMLFKGHRDILSNMYNYKLIKYNHVFNRNEALNQYEKAMVHNIQEITVEITNSTNGCKAKRINKKVNYEWHQGKVDVKKKLLNTKLTQCDKFRRKLQKCKGKLLVEGTFDRFLGAGSTIVNSTFYCGKNTLGHIIMNLI